jgi:hypothetical protein
MQQFNIYYRNLRTNSLCRGSVRPMTWPQAVAARNSHNSKSLKLHGEAWIDLHSPPIENGNVFLAVDGGQLGSVPLPASAAPLHL